MKRRRRPFWTPLLALTALLIAGIGGWLYVNTSVPYRLKTLRALLDEYTEAGDKPASARALERILELDPDDQQGALRLAELYGSLARPRDAEALLRSHLEQHPGALRFRLALAQQLVKETRMGEAYGLVLPELAAIEAHPDVGDRAKGLILAGELLADRGQVDEGLGLIERAVELRETHGLRAQDTGDGRALGLLAQGRVLERAGLLADAARALRAAVEIAPDGPQARLQLGHVLAAAGELDETEATLLDFYTQGGQQRRVVLPLLAQALVRGGALERADALAARLSDDGEVALAAYTRGLIALERGELDDARQAFQAMAAAEPESAVAPLQLARTSLRGGDPLGAEESLEAALRAAPGALLAELALLELERRAGESEEVRGRALRLLQQPAAREPALRALLGLSARGDGEARQEAIDTLESLRRDNPYDTSLRLYAALLRLLGGEASGLEELAELAAHPALELEAPLGLLLLDDGAGSREVLEAVAALSAERESLAPAKLLLARVYLALGLPDRAGAELDKALELRPDWRTARLARIRLAVAQDDLELAAQLLEQLREQDLGDVVALDALADVRLLQGEHELAMGLLSRACQLSPESGRALARLARAQALAGKQRAAEKTFADAQRMSPEEPLVYQDGAVALLLGEAGDAVAALRQGALITRSVAYEAAWGAALALEQHPEAGLLPLRHWLTGRHSPAGLLTLALITQRAGDAEGAADAARRAIAAGAPASLVRAALEAPAPVIDWSLRAFGLLALDWLPEAQGWLQAAPKSVAGHPLQLWWALHGSRGAELRLDHARRLAAALPGVDTGLLLSRLEARAGDHEARLHTLEALDARWPGDPQVGLELAIALERRGDAEAARTRYLELVSGDAPQPLALNNAAWALRADEGRRGLAIDYARAAATRAPRWPAPQHTLGWLLFLDRQWVEAQLRLDQAVRLAPGNPTYRLHLAAALEALGQREAASLQLRTALLARERLDDPALADSLLAALAADDLAPARELSVGRAQRDLLSPATPLRWSVRAAQLDRLVELRCLAPPGTSLELLLPEGRKPLRVGSAGQLTLPALRLPAAGSTLMMRGDQAGPVELLLEVLPGDSGRAYEPDETPASAQPLASGAALAGVLDGPADQEHMVLALSERPHDVLVSAGSRSPLRVELLAWRAGETVILRSVTLPAEGALALRGLVVSQAALRVLRLSGRVSDGPGPTPDWRASLVPADTTADLEPNDDASEALSLVDGVARGELDPADAVDWYRVPASAGKLWSLRLSGGAALEVWERGLGDGALRLRARADPAAGEARLRWRVSWETQLYLAVRAAAPRTAPSPYELRAELEPTQLSGRELEPNDHPLQANPVSTPGWEASFGTARDIDWFRPKAGLFALQVHGPAGALRLYAGPHEHPNLLLSLAGDAQGLSVPVLRVPEDGLLALEGVSALGSYSVVLRQLEAVAGQEVEPNGALDQAQELVLATELQGALSGDGDRDLLRLPERTRSLTVTADASPLRAGLLGDPLQDVTPDSPWVLGGALGRRVLVIEPGPGQGLIPYRVQTAP